MAEPRPQHLATPRSVKAAAWSVGLTWAAAVIAAAIGLTQGNLGMGLMAMVAALNAMGWWVATRRWVEWSAFCLALLGHLEGGEGGD